MRRMSATPAPATSSPPAIEIEDLEVSYGRHQAVRKLSLAVRPGEIVGLLGPNGAGKSTTLLAAAGALTPSAGRVRIGGADLADEPLLARTRVGLADQPPSLYEFLTVEEHVAFVAEARGGDAGEVRRYLADLGLAPVAGKLCRELSFGMRQRVGLAAALAGSPQVLLLDESLNGLDPRAARAARDVLGAAAEDGRTVILSTHMLGVAERLCGRIALMDAGQLVADYAGAELEALLASGPGALEARYLELVAEEQAT
jgi:ABC-2 type transport system ATP-binding protein